MGDYPSRSEMWRYYWKYNLAVTPLLLIRAPIMVLAMALTWTGAQLGRLGEAIPGWRV